MTFQWFDKWASRPLVANHKVHEVMGSEETPHPIPTTRRMLVHGDGCRPRLPITASLREHAVSPAKVAGVILGPGDTSRGRPARIIVAGTSGAGKTTLSAAISRTLGIEYVEIDALYHGPDWTRRESFEADVAEFSSRAEWVTEWQYGVVRDQLADRADLVVWLDLPRRSVMRQVVTRTVRRRFTREVLWNDNIEPPLHRILFEADHIVRWAWTTHHKTSTRIDELSERLPHLDIVRLRSRAEIDKWVAFSLPGWCPRR